MKHSLRKFGIGAAAFLLMTAILTTVVILAAEEPYSEIRWSFEDGVLEPFYTDDDWGALRLILDRDTDRNDGVTPMQKDGKYYLCTVFFEDQNNYDESFTGHIYSPDFLIGSPTVRVKIAGGSGNYVAVVRASDEEVLAKASNPLGSGHPLQEVTLDLGGKYTEGERVYIDICDNTTGGWGFISVDDIRVKGKVCEEERKLEPAAMLKRASGYSASIFGELTGRIEAYRTNYPDCDVSKLSGEIGELQAEWDKLSQEETISSETAAALGERIASVEREIVLAHPLLQGKQLVFVTRHQYAGDHHNTHTMFPSYAGEFNQGVFVPGGAIKCFDFVTGKVTVLAESKKGVYRDLEVSDDGTKLLYSFRQSAEDSYHVYESTLDGGASVASTAQLTSLAGADDMDPLYLPNGQIVFSSTRSAKYVMCNRHIASNIYRMNADGSNIVKITNSTLFERPTDVMADGRILYDRWEYVDKDFGSAQGVWTCNPDGTLQNTYYGNNTPTGAYVDAHEIPGTNRIAATLTSTHDRPWGGIVILDRSTATDGRKAVVHTWPESLYDRIAEAGSGLDIDAATGLSVKYEDPCPLDENTFLVTRQIRAGSEKTGIFLIDTAGNEVLIYEDDGSMGAFDVHLLERAEEEPFVLSERRNYLDNYGTFFVQDVYEGTHMAGVKRGSVAYLRVIESVPKHYFTQYSDWQAQGQQFPAVNWHSFEVKKVLGDVPVYEDGSAYFAVPQDAFVYFQLISEDGRMIQSMRSGTLVQSGEQTGCVGCHEDAATAPLHSAGNAAPMALVQSFTVVDGVGKNVPDEIVRADYMPEGNLNFLTDIQPIFTANCVSCHGYEDPKASLTLVEDKTLVFNASYVDLWRSRGGRSGYYQNLLNVVGGGGTEFTPAKSWGSYASPLIQKLYDPNDAHSTYLSDSERRAVAMWVDANAPYYGDFATNYPTNLGGRCPLDAQELAKLPGLSYSNAYYGTGAAEIYFDHPELSPYLKKLEASPSLYEKALEIIRRGQQRLEENPDVDMPGYVMGSTDAWRTEKVQYREEIEAENRKAVADGAVLYDSDHRDAPDTAFPGYNN